MATTPDSWFSKWLKNGRLSGLTFAIILTLWVAFTIAKVSSEAIAPLVTLLYLSGGTFIGNLALKENAERQSLKKQVQELKEKVEVDSEST